MTTTLVIFLFILGLLIFVHEVGHFWLAKKVGVAVLEFAFGFRPRLFSWKRGETVYAINLLPFGGYVRLEGEEEATSPRAFAAQPPARRAAIAVAGVVMNLLLAWVLLSLAYGLGSYPLTATFDQHRGVMTDRQVMIAQVAPGSPAAAAGLAKHDIVLELDGEVISDPESLRAEISQRAGREIALTIRRQGETRQLRPVPRPIPPPGEGALGITTAVASVAKVVWYRAPLVALFEVASEIRSAIAGFSRFIATLLVKQEVGEEVTGLVGIGAATGIVRQLGVAPLAQFVAYISTNLAVINLLPILPLDGGHLLLIGLEAWRKKPLGEKYRQWLTLAGLAFILLLFFVVTYQDVLRFAIVEKLRAIF